MDFQKIRFSALRIIYPFRFDTDRVRCLVVRNAGARGGATRFIHPDLSVFRTFCYQSLDEKVRHHVLCIEDFGNRLRLFRGVSDGTAVASNTDPDYDGDEPTGSRFAEHVALSQEGGIEIDKSDLVDPFALDGSEPKELLKEILFSGYIRYLRKEGWEMARKDFAKLVVWISANGLIYVWMKLLVHDRINLLFWLGLAFVNGLAWGLWELRDQKKKKEQR